MAIAVAETTGGVGLRADSQLSMSPRTERSGLISGGFTARERPTVKNRSRRQRRPRPRMSRNPLGSIIAEQEVMQHDFDRRARSKALQKQLRPPQAFPSLIPSVQGFVEFLKGVV